MSAPEGWLDNDTSDLPVPRESTVYDALSSHRRRLAVLTLGRVEAPLSLGRLSRLIAAMEDGTTPDAVGSDRRKAVYVGLYQVHTEVLDDAGLVEYDERTKDLTPTARTYRVAESLAETLAAEHPEIVEGVDRVLAEAGYGAYHATIPVDVSMFRVPTGEQFKALRKAVGVQQGDVADAVGVSQGTFSNFENGRNDGINSGTLRDAVEHLRRVGGRE